MISSLLPHKDLNSRIWPSGVEGKINPDVRKHLLQIAVDFKKTLELTEVGLGGQVQIIDLVMTGSLANYNFTEHSDIDLHLIADYSNVNPEFLPVVKAYLDDKRLLYAFKQDIKIFGFDVELYVQDKDEKHISSGTYSLIKDEWVIHPTTEFKEPDRVWVEQKALALMSFIDKLISNAEIGTPEQMLPIVDKTKKKIKELRAIALDIGGEFNEGNILFKILRHTGYLEKLDKLKKDLIDKHLSMQERLKRRKVD
jgi:hypothetical protein